MREILFRGKRVDNGEWVYGDLLHPDIYGNGYSIEDFTKEKNNCFDVIPESIGQHTGLTDKNDTKIFEGDIVRMHFVDCVEIGEIMWGEELCKIVYLSSDGFKYGIDSTVEAEVIGNIHDNPKLLEA